MMQSLRTKITIYAALLILTAAAALTSLSVLYVKNDEQVETNQLLLLLCETGEHNLDYYFTNVQKSVETMAAFVEEDLDRLEQPDDAALVRHMAHARRFFEETANKTDGALTYYYRLDPAISDTELGFWYTDLDGKGFGERQVTDIRLYDTEDTAGLVWFTVPKQTGRSIWQTPYISENLDRRVVSYNVPVYRKGGFFGVVGIEIDFATMATQVDSIRLSSNGYAFLCDADGKLFYHPRIDVTHLSSEIMPQPPEGILNESTFLNYRYDGVKKQAAWLPVGNGMRLYVTVPSSELYGDWQKLLVRCVLASAIVLVSLSAAAAYMAGRIKKPLDELLRAAQQVDQGNFNVSLRYAGQDEIGRLTKLLRHVFSDLAEKLSTLNNRVYVDALTSVKNKGAFTAAIDALQTRIEQDRQAPEFAIGVFDCDDLKSINDQYGHDKGDAYLKNACRLICQVFQHSPVFRIGGDEFAVILQNSDFHKREELVRTFKAGAAESLAAPGGSWEHVQIAMGIAVYDGTNDASALDTVRRADVMMYSNKRLKKGQAARDVLSE